MSKAVVCFLHYCMLRS